MQRLQTWLFVKKKTFSTNLYGSLRFGTNERVLLRWRYPTIGSLCPPITTTKGEGYYVEFFFNICLCFEVDGVQNVLGIKA